MLVSKPCRGAARFAFGVASFLLVAAAAAGQEDAAPGLAESGTAEAAGASPTAALEEMVVVTAGHSEQPLDEVVDRRTAVFTSRYEALVQAFERGRRVRVQLRFWPTWPKTGTHAATFSLIGFTRARARLADCRTP